MSKSTRPLGDADLTLAARPNGTPIRRWLYDELRRAILEGRLRRGDRLPATRRLAAQYGVSRGVVVEVFEQMRAEGYFKSRPGSATHVNQSLPDDLMNAPGPGLPTPERRLQNPPPNRRKRLRPFQPGEPALGSFPMDVWARLAARRMRRISVNDLAFGDPLGYMPLREAIAAYLGASRGVVCTAENVAITSGVQQSLDLFARILLKPGDLIWLEDPAYFGARDAFRLAGAKIVPVNVDEQGLLVSQGRRRSPRAKAAYVTPGHQFGLASAMAAERRLDLLAWANEAGAYIIEDDYDSEFRFEGRPMPALQGLDKSRRVIYLGTFNKTLYSSFRLGYAVIPWDLIDRYAALRFQVDRSPPSVVQAVLCDFLTEGHFGRHLRRMRETYAERLEALGKHSRRYLAGMLELSRIQAGLHSPAFLVNGARSEEVQGRARERDIVVVGLHNFLLRRRDIEGLLLGFAPFTSTQLRRATQTLAEILETTHPKKTRIGLAQAPTGTVNL